MANSNVGGFVLAKEILSVFIYVKDLGKSKHSASTSLASRNIIIKRPALIHYLWCPTGHGRLTDTIVKIKLPMMRNVIGYLYV